jgi:hypothetical protein
MVLATCGLDNLRNGGFLADIDDIIKLKFMDNLMVLQLPYSIVWSLLRGSVFGQAGNHVVGLTGLDEAVHVICSCEYYHLTHLNVFVEMQP